MCAVCSAETSREQCRLQNSKVSRIYHNGCLIHLFNLRHWVLFQQNFHFAQSAVFSFLAVFERTVVGPEFPAYQSRQFLCKHNHSSKYRDLIICSGWLFTLWFSEFVNDHQNTKRIRAMTSLSSTLISGNNFNSQFCLHKKEKIYRK